MTCRVSQKTKKKKIERNHPSRGNKIKNKNKKEERKYHEKI